MVLANALRQHVGTRQCSCQVTQVPSTQWQHRPVAIRRAVKAAAMTPQEELRKMESDRVQLRSEAEAPFRPLRLVLYGFSVMSASVAFLISIPQLIGATAGAPGALATDDVLQNIGINLGAILLFGWLFAQDWKAREKQVARIAREEALGALQVRLASGKRLRLADLQGTSRVVLVVGTQQQVEDAVAAAEPYREALQRRGVLLVPLPVYGSSEQGASLAAPGPDELRWRATPLQPEAWKEWFTQQLALVPNARPERGLYVGLRLDGRVRASGMGQPPWARFAVELAPVEGEGKWVGFFDGFDGKV